MITMMPFWTPLLFILITISLVNDVTSSFLDDKRCSCHPFWARCNIGMGEDGYNGCHENHRIKRDSSKKAQGDDHAGKSCAEQCEGDLVWKKLYQSSVEQQKIFQNQCQSDPTASWDKPPVFHYGDDGSGGGGGSDNDHKNIPPFRVAIAFAGGLRNFVTTWHSWQANLIEPSGGPSLNYHFNHVDVGHRNDKNDKNHGVIDDHNDKSSSIFATDRVTQFDLYFHVWHDEKTGGRNSAIRERGISLAKSLPYTKAYVHESYYDYISLLNQDEPDFDGNVNTNHSWIEPIVKEFNPSDGRIRPPYTFGPGYSQFRKVYLAMQLIKNSKIQYSLVIRARPDHMFITPIDLRQLVKDFRERPMVRNANGHFLVIPERHQGQRLSDHFALGTQAAMSAYGSKPLPYTTPCCEGYVHQNLHMRCFFRSEDVFKEEFVDMKQVSAEYDTATVKCGAGYSVISANQRRSKFSPMMNTGILFSGFGSNTCLQKNHKCVPTYKSKLVYIYNVVTSAWFKAGVMCIGRYAKQDEADYLIFAGYADRVDESAAQKYGFGPCLVLDNLKRAYNLTRDYLAYSLSQSERMTLAKELTAAPRPRQNRQPKTEQPK